MPARRSTKWWLAWLLPSLCAVGFLAWLLLDARPGPMRAWFSPGPMTSGHHGIELACEACHTSPFGGGEVLQAACEGCHAAQLKRADDSHPAAKFTDPRNADLLDVIDGRFCVSCHSEHRPGITGDMGLTLPADYCVTCHRDVGDERPTHAGLGFETCASAGCHNYHDNRALYEDFLLRHAHQPMLLAPALLPARDFDRRWLQQHVPQPAQAPDRRDADPAVIKQWLMSSHAEAGVQCSACHQANDSAWTDHPAHDACQGCHENEVDGFLAGKHGMRLAAGLAPMQPADARLPMREDAAHRALGCASCHGAHDFDTASAAVESCLGCHADSHSQAFLKSPHFALWQAEQSGQAPVGSGVSCASCHLPRIVEERAGKSEVFVQHNQNDVQRPREAMIRPVCMNCHGLGFALDAMADDALVQRNFRGKPSGHVRSIDMALDNAEADRARRGAGP